MEIGCDCGLFSARLTAFPQNTPGRLVCYCKDCQQYLKLIDRPDLLDEFGGTQVIPAYPAEIDVVQGLDKLTCYRLTDAGLHRWATSCCNTPIANARPGFPWAGIMHCAYTNKDPDALSRLGEVKSRIFGRDAKAGAPFEISEKLGLKALLTVLPFVLKGKLLKLGRGSPFFQADNVTPIVEPVILKQES